MAWQFAGSLAAVIFLVLFAWQFGFRGAPQLEDKAHAEALAREVHGGFEAVATALDRARHAALLRDGAGRIVLVAPAGAHFVARLLAPRTPAVRDGARLTVGKVGLELGEDAGDWERAIAALH